MLRFSIDMRCRCALSRPKRQKPRPETRNNKSYRHSMLQFLLLLMLLFINLLSLCVRTEKRQKTEYDLKLEFHVFGDKFPVLWNIVKRTEGISLSVSFIVMYQRQAFNDSIKKAFHVRSFQELNDVEHRHVALTRFYLSPRQAKQESTSA